MPRCSATTVRPIANRRSTPNISSKAPSRTSTAISIRSAASSAPSPRCWASITRRLRRNRRRRFPPLEPLSLQSRFRQPPQPKRPTNPKRSAGSGAASSVAASDTIRLEEAMPFRDVIGHRRLVDLLARAVSRASLPPSLIFAGPDGVGKRFVAAATAQALNCPNITAGSDRADACGTCSSCTRIARGMHPDVLIVEPGDIGNIKIEQVRDVVDRAGYRPFEGKRRVVIIDEADALMPQAQNALLKTLEEPPPSSVFLLITARPDALLLTVLSRCPRLRFRPLDAGDVAAAMIRSGRK